MKKSKCPHCGKPVIEELAVSGGFGAGQHQWQGDCDKCGASWSYWQYGQRGTKEHWDIEFEEFEEEGED